MEPGALRSALLNNICEELKDELVMHDLPAFFNDLMSLCIKVKERLQACRSQRNYNSHKSVGFLGTGAMAESGSSRAHKGADGEEPMQLGVSHITAAERQRRISAGECLYCSHKAHVVATCP